MTQESNRLVMTLLVRDEIDIIRENIAFHLHHGVDAVIVTDNGSVDGTREILQSLTQTAPVYVIDEPKQDYSQSEWVTRMAHMAREQLNATWVLHNDADEFWYPASGDLKTELRDASFNVLRCYRVNMMPDRSTLARPGYRFYHNTIRAPGVFCVNPNRLLNENMYLAQPSAKVLSKCEGLRNVAQGNHNVEIDNYRAADSTNITIFHYPIRAYAQFERKIINGGSSYGANQHLPSSAGWHWRDFYEQWKRGALPAAFDLLIPDTEQAKQYQAVGDVDVDFTMRGLIENDYRRFLDYAPSMTYGADFYDMHHAWRKEYRIIADTLRSLISFDSVLDLGCGNGYLLADFFARGAKVRGADGSAHAIAQGAQMLPGAVELRDLRLPLFLGRFDLVLCTEVAEHLEEQYADTLVDTICRNADRFVYFTGATPEQTGGLDHVNLQLHDYWIEKFSTRGFVLRQYLTDQLRNRLTAAITEIVWFPKNSMMFERANRHSV